MWCCTIRRNYYARQQVHLLEEHKASQRGNHLTVRPDDVNCPIHMPGGHSPTMPHTMQSVQPVAAYEQAAAGSRAVAVMHNHRARACPAHLARHEIGQATALCASRRACSAAS
jgi:hypothetical protein